MPDLGLNVAKSKMSVFCRHLTHLLPGQKLIGLLRLLHFSHFRVRVS